MKFRKKPIIVDAVQWQHGKDISGVLRIPATRVDATATRGIIFDRPERHVVNTLEGQLDVSPGDWIITGVKGEKYPVKPDIFDLCYEPVNMAVEAIASVTRFSRAIQGSFMLILLVVLIFWPQIKGWVNQ